MNCRLQFCHLMYELMIDALIMDDGNPEECWRMVEGLEIGYWLQYNLKI